MRSFVAAAVGFAVGLVGAKTLATDVPPSVFVTWDGGSCSATIQVGVRGCDVSWHRDFGDLDQFGSYHICCGQQFDACGAKRFCDCRGALIDAGLLWPDGGRCVDRWGKFPDGGKGVIWCRGGPVSVHAGPVDDVPLSWPTQVNPCW